MVLCKKQANKKTCKSVFSVHWLLDLNSSYTYIHIMQPYEVEVTLKLKVKLINLIITTEKIGWI